MNPKLNQNIQFYINNKFKNLTPIFECGKIIHTIFETIKYFNYMDLHIYNLVHDKNK